MDTVNNTSGYTAKTQAIIDALKAIPYGRVDTYGHVAQRAGLPGGARQVVRILSTLSEKEALPWHRVVNAKLEIALKGGGAGLQAALLQEEGVEVINGRVTRGFAL